MVVVVLQTIPRPGKVCDAEEDITGVVDDDENTKQLLYLSTIFVVDVKVVLYL